VAEKHRFTKTLLTAKDFADMRSVNWRLLITVDTLSGEDVIPGFSRSVAELFA
jgi:hypothetical protein